jgi:hypothetical protein
VALRLKSLETPGLENVRTVTSYNPIGLHGPLRKWLYFVETIVRSEIYLKWTCVFTVGNTELAYLQQPYSSGNVCDADMKSSLGQEELNSTPRHGNFFPESKECEGRDMSLNIQ